MRYSSTTDVEVSSSRIYSAGRGEYGRSISPNYIEDVINNGYSSKCIVNGSTRIIYELGDVTEGDGTVVVTVITK